MQCIFVRRFRSFNRVGKALTVYNVVSIANKVSDVNRLRKRQTKLS